MAKTTTVVECYSGLYEEGEVEHINDPHRPSQESGDANQKADENGGIVALYRRRARGKWVDGRSKSYESIINKASN